MTRTAQFAVGVALAGGFVWLILRDLDWNALHDAFRAPDLRWLALGFAFWMAGYTMRVLRWRAMLAIANPARNMSRHQIHRCHVVKH